MKQSSYASAHAKLITFFLLSSLARSPAQQSLETNFRITGDAIVAAFAPQRAIIQHASAVIYQGRKELAYATVITPDGYLLSKASEIEGKTDLSARIDQQTFGEIKIILIDRLWDVALIKLDAQNLLPAEFAASSDLPQGTWVIVNGATSRANRRVLAGIISASRREIPATGGAIMGVQLKDSSGKITIEAITPASGAELAGLLAGDIILSIDGTKMTTGKQVTEHLATKKAGEILKLTIKRGDESLDLDVTLTARAELAVESTRNDQMSGDFSRRRSGFPKVIQHDIIANSNTMGGPVLGLDGKILGMNIARANRAETFAIPVEQLREISSRLLTQAVK